ncbi:MAG TPA: M13 family metallopeptidase [Lysobacter sp.]|nr:M13 family metallopeptidase [Lysobacter sp.]
MSFVSSPRFRRARLSLLLAVALLPAAAAIGADAPPAPDFLRANMNTAVDPGVDFFEYANGGWLKAHPIPASESAWGIGNEVDDQLRTTLRKINEDAAKGRHPQGSDQQKIGDFWTTAMDTALADRLGAQPLAPELAKIDAARDVDAVLDRAFAMAPIGVRSFFRFGVYQDEKDSAAMAVHLSQGGLGLPDRDFYFNPEQGVAHIREEYVAHLARTLQLLGRDEAGAKDAAAKVMAFETELAKASRKREDLRDPQRNYNRMALGDVTAKLTPRLGWSARLAAWKLEPQTVIVGQPEFFTALDKLLKETPVPVLQDYLRVRLVDRYGDNLGKAFDDEVFRFYGQVLSGQKEQRPRWKRVLDDEGGAMGMVLGRIFVKDYFPEAAKQRYVTMVDAIRDAYAARIDRLEWMSPDTKAKAHAKLKSIVPKVGYPDQWKDYSALVIGRNSYAENMMNAARWNFADMLSKYGKPVDRSEWEMTPQTYNAYYNPSNNEIVLPAAIFTIPGMLDANVDDAVVYGYAGASTIGHEITHGFDDEGRQFDVAGNLSDWWTAQDDAKFRERAALMVKQFDAYEPLPGLHINGKASLGENIADYGGVLLGLDAFKQTEQYRKGGKIGGLTPLQRYFLGYALGWMTQQREQVLRSRLLSDVHAPAKWRVLGPMSNIPEFYEAFDIKPGQPMWRPEQERVRIW